MKKRKRWVDPDRPVGKLTIVPNFLPPPEELVPPGSKIKMTIELDLETYDFFTEQARKHKGKYQRMIREVLRRYAQHHSTRRAA